MEINFGFYITLVFIVLILPTISFFSGRFKSLAIEFVGASLSLLVALFVQLFNIDNFPNEMIFVLLISVILHASAIPFLILLTKIHSKIQEDESFIWAAAAFPFSLLLANCLLFITASMTLNSDKLINVGKIKGQESINLVSEIFKNDSLIVFWMLIVVLIVTSITRLYYLKHYVFLAPKKKLGCRHD